MPVYGANTLVSNFRWSPTTPPVLDENRPIALFNAETVTAGTASQQVCLPRNEGNHPKLVSLAIDFASDPGTFQLDVQTADEDAAANYVTTESITSGLNSSYNTRIELSDAIASWLRVVLVSSTNSVALTVKATRHY
jgi:hypothetical protein